MLFSVIASLLNGVMIEFVGLLPAASLINLSAIGVNVLSMINYLAIQRLTFILFIFSRASIYTITFGYTLGRV